MVVDVSNRRVILDLPDIQKLIEFFSTDKKPCLIAELISLLGSLTEEELIDIADGCF